MHLSLRIVLKCIALIKAIFGRLARVIAARTYCQRIGFVELLSEVQLVQIIKVIYIEHDPGVGDAVLISRGGGQRLLRMPATSYTRRHGLCVELRNVCLSCCFDRTL